MAYYVPILLIFRAVTLNQHYFLIHGLARLKKLHYLENRQTILEAERIKSMTVLPPAQFPIRLLLLLPTITA